jgi:hypothetical protein
MNVLALTLVLLAPQQQGKKWSDMDYGPYMTHSFESAGKDITYKGIKVRLGTDGASMLFDADLLRWSAGWLKSSLDWRSIVYDGSHQTHPKVLGEPAFTTPRRPRPKGGRFRGVYLHGEKVILSYTIGETKVLEMAGLDGTTLTRTVEASNDVDLDGPMPTRGVLEPLTHGGPARWPTKIETKMTLGSEDGPFAMDTLALPAANPWRAWMRPGGFDFFSDGTRAAVCTWNGDVWIVSGVGSEKLTWQRIATGLFQPLGLKIVDDRIHVTCRDQIARLHDLNGDGEIDFVECFNGDAQVTEHFHEFAMGLQTDAAGNFYYAKAARHALEATTEQHGTLIRVSKDGSTSEIVCRGFRAPNGVGIGPKGELAASDQEGHWMPANRINLLREGGFYGNNMGLLGAKRDAYDPPIVWLHPKVDRSPAEQLWVTSDAWGPLKGMMLSTSYGTGRMFLIPYEVVNGVPQGAAVALPLQFPTGIMRARFHPKDGHLYAAGLFGWSSDCTLEGGLYRVRRTSKPLRLPIGVHVADGAVELTFAEPLEKASAEDLDGWGGRQWNYRWTKNYGSKNYKVSAPEQQGEDPVEITKVALRGDRTLVLSIRDLKPVMSMELTYSTPTRGKIWLTINPSK